MVKIGRLYQLSFKIESNPEKISLAVYLRRGAKDSQLKSSNRGMLKTI